MKMTMGATLVAAALFGTATMAQDFKPDPVDEAAAKREGSVTWYTSTPVAAAQHIASEFERRTGIKVEMLRTGGQNVIRRFLQEADAGRIAVDVITMSDMSAANAMTRRGLFVPFKPAGFDQVIADAKDASTGTDVTTVQWLRFGPNAYMQMFAIARKAAWNDVFPRLRQIRDSIEPR